MRTPPLQALLLACFAALLAPASAAPPRVVHASPDHADLAVDPATATIRITFDQEMRPGGRSICGGGPSFPAFADKPHWQDAWTFVIPVKLEPEHAYSISINCPSAQNFRGITGEPAEIYPISFRTGKPGESPPTLTREHIADLTKALRRAIDDHYSYRDLRVKDWDKAFADAQPTFDAAETPSAFARAAVKLLAAAEDIHLGVVVGDMRLGTYRREAPGNFNARAVQKLVPEYKSHNDRVATGRFGDGIVYLLITSWSVEQAEDQLKPAFDAIDAARDANAPGLILDVRPNGGGDELVARSIAARFLSEPKVYSKNRLRNPKSPTGWDGPFDRVVQPAQDAKPYTGKVAVLIGQACASSNESFIKMLHDPPRRQLFGDRTFGSSGRPIRHDLGHDLQVSLPSWQDMMPDGTLLEGAGIAPDRPIPNAPTNTTDPILDAAITWLREK